MTITLRTLLALGYFISVDFSAHAGTFADINLGDKYDTVIAKLQKSKFASTDAPETMLGRLGINGVFKTTQKIDGNEFTLFFTFEDQRLVELHLHSPPQSTAFDAKALHASVTQHLNRIYGAAPQKAMEPDLSEFPVNAGSLFQIWYPSNSGSLLTGYQRTPAGFEVIINFKSERISLQAEPN